MDREFSREPFAKVILGTKTVSVSCVRGDDLEVWHFPSKLPELNAVEGCWDQLQEWFKYRLIGMYAEEKPPVFTLVDRGSDQRYVFPAKAADETTVRLLLVLSEEESLTVYTDGFRAYDPLENDENFHREAVIHGDGEYVNGDAHVNTCESHRRERDGGSRRIEVSQNKLTVYLRSFQLRRRILRKPGREVLKQIVRAVL